MNSLRMSFWIVPDELVLRHALLLGRHDVAGQHRQHGAVHGHRHAHLVERDAVEQDLHVLDGIDRHAGLADIADDARMIASRSRDGWRDRRPPTGPSGRPRDWRDRTCCSPRRSRSRHTGGPSRDGRHTSWPCGPRVKGGKPGSEPRRLEALEVGRRVERLHRDALGGHPGRGRSSGRVAQLLGGELLPVGEGLLRKIGHTPSM